MTILALGSGHNGPLCPMVGTETAYGTAHRVQVMVYDAAYDAAPRDADGEPVEPVVNAMLGAVDARFPAYMDLYEHVVSTQRDGVYRASWFQCRTCGFVLPTERQ